MVILRFRSKMDHKDLLKKVKKMKEFTEDLEECLSEAYEDEDMDFRGGSYRKEWDDEEESVHGRYGYRRGMK